MKAESSDSVWMKCLIFQYLYDLSDPVLEDALIDRLNFQRFLGISFDTEIPDFMTIWRFLERLIKAGLLNKIMMRPAHRKVADSITTIKAISASMKDRTLFDGCVLLRPVYMTRGSWKIC